MNLSTKLKLYADVILLNKSTKVLTDISNKLNTVTVKNKV